MVAEEPVPQQSGHLVVGGQRVWWEYFGHGDREAVCLLNGLAMHTKAWYGLLPLLSDDYDIVLYDYLGQGDSSKEDIPYSIPEFARYLELILDELGIARIHLMGISYGGFIALDFARVFQQRLHTMVLSGILLSRETLFEMYEELSLRFYRGSREAFELYTHYMYEKIFGEAFVTALGRDKLEPMRQRFYDRYVDLRHCLIRLTEAQDPFFARIDELMPQYRAIQTPTLIVAGEQDRAIPLWQQRKLCEILPSSRMELIADSGHVVYLEQPQRFFAMLKTFMGAKSLAF
jgi:3-oxoadipate enol-lactonase